MTENSRETML